MKLTQLKPMTSLEVADVLNAQRAGTGAAVVRHDAVLQKIRLLVPDAESYSDLTSIRARPAYRLTTEQVTTLLSSYVYMREAVLALIPKGAVSVVEAPVASSPVELKVTDTDGVQTMSSLDMVAYINATRKPGEGELRHDNFMAKVPEVLKDALRFKAVYLGANGESRPCYKFPRREATFMAMSYSYELQQTVYDAWQAAEAKVASPVVSLPSYSEALRALADSVERNEKQTLQITQQATQITTQAVQIEAAAPAVAFVDKYVAGEGKFTFRQVAKLLNAPEREFRNFLADRKIMTQLNGTWTHHARHEVAGRFDTDTGTTGPVEGYPQGRTWTRSFFTAKGITWITKLWDERVPMLRKPIVTPKGGY